MAGEAGLDIFIPGPGTAIGTATGGPIGGLVGSFFDGLFGKGGGGLGKALNAGLGSLFSSSSSSNTTQAQSVEQGTRVDVSNILGRPFGNYNTTTGEFDAYTALADIYKIRDAMAATAPVTSSTPVPATQPKKLNLTPVYIVGALAAALYIFKGKGK